MKVFAKKEELKKMIIQWGLRQKKQSSQADFARASGLTPEGLSNIINGHSSPYPTSRGKIMKTLSLKGSDWKLIFRQEDNK